MPRVDKKRISYHLADLLGRDVSVVADILEWLKPSARDLARRAYPKRLLARYMAAQVIDAAGKGNATMLGHCLDRTEGKVASGDPGQNILIQFNFGLSVGGGQLGMPSHDLADPCRESIQGPERSLLAQIRDADTPGEIMVNTGLHLQAAFADQDDDDDDEGVL